MVFGDSQLVINQINKVYKVRNVLLMDLYEKVKQLKKNFKTINFAHVYREENKRADYLANLAIKVCYDKQSIKMIDNDLNNDLNKDSETETDINEEDTDPE